MLTMFSGPYAVLARIASLLIAIGGIYLAGWVKGHHSAEVDFATFRAKVATLGEEQERRTAEIIKAQNARKDASDATLKLRIANLAADNDRLRRNAGASSLPAPAPDSRCPSEWACFDREALDAAIRDFTRETAELIGTGEEVRLRLATAIEWAR